MKTGTVQSVTAFGRARLDPKHYLSVSAAYGDLLRAVAAAGIEFVPLGKLAEAIWAPGRFKRTYAVVDELSVAYLRPYDIFEYLPDAADHLSAKRTDNLDSYRVSAGMILQTCSGRNLGPAVIVDAYLERFVLSHDLLRVEVADELGRLYVLAYLRSSLGQAMVRRDKTGSVIDHVSDVHLASVDVPILPEQDRLLISGLMKESLRLRERARMGLLHQIESYERQLPSIPSVALPAGWTVKSADCASRLDAASYSPMVRATRAELLANGGCEIREVAKVVKPAGRYKTRYVGPEYGLAILSGANALQATPINLQYIAPQALHSVPAYRLGSDWTIFQADGRAEEGLGVPAMVTPDRAGWLASGHVGRIIPNAGVDPGWLYLAWRCSVVQLQVKALACGSVVDALYPEELEHVVVPKPGDGKAVLDAWHAMAAAQESEDRALGELEKAMVKAAA